VPVLDSGSPGRTRLRRLLGVARTPTGAPDPVLSRRRHP
jgi:hypothetical protein